MAEPEIQKAVDVLEESGFTPAQLQGYDDFWDAVRVERTIRESAEERGYAEGMAKGIEEGMAKGELQRSLAIAQKMKQSGVSDPQIMEFTGLTLEQIKSLGK